MGLVQKFKRGQVWMVKEDKRLTELRMQLNDIMECKTRPFVILTSNVDIETNSILLTCVPITSNITTMRSSDIIFRNYESEQNRIIVSEVQTKESKYFISYMYTMPDDIMMQIDKISSGRIGIGSSLKNISDEIAKLQMTLDHLKKSAEKIFADTICTSMQRDNITQLPVRKVTSSVKKEQPEATTKITVTENKTGVAKSTNVKTNTKRKYHKWTEDEAKEFLNTESIDDLCDKYGKNQEQIQKLQYYLTKKFYQK